MARTLITGVALLAAAGAVAADDSAAPAPAATVSATATAPAATVPAATVAANVSPAGKAPTGGQVKAPAGLAASTELPQQGGDVKMSGMSILGNEDAPKSLVLVPWKSSQLAAMPSVSRLLDSAAQPVDKEVFLRELSYYEFKAGPK